MKTRTVVYGLQGPRGSCPILSFGERVDLSVLLPEKVHPLRLIIPSDVGDKLVIEHVRFDEEDFLVVEVSARMFDERMIGCPDLPRRARRVVVGLCHVGAWKWRAWVPGLVRRVISYVFFRRWHVGWPLRRFDDTPVVATATLLCDAVMEEPIGVPVKRGG